MKLKISFVRIAAALATAAFAAPQAEGPVIDPSFFPDRDGWLGGDSAYSIPLDESSALWLFGDTFAGGDRQRGKMIHNSIAIRSCREGCTLSYAWRGMHGGTPDSFFRTPESSYYWPLDGFAYRDKLYVFLEQMHSTGKGGAFGFDYSGVTLATISNFRAEPGRWEISYRTVSSGNQVVPGVAAAITMESDERFVYVFTLFRRSAAQPFLGLMRLPFASLSSEGTPAGWQYLSQDREWQTWTPSTSPADAWKALSGNITEMSVKYHPEIQQWIAVFPTPGGLSNTASYSASRTLDGRWLEPRTLFHYPEMRKKDARYTPNVFCYAAKEHPELESKGEIAFTYACNSTRVSEIFEDTRLYRPQLVREKLPMR